ncbi:HDIG domain-containing protein [Patescibacteria group bacterium]|nr:HDIG domain-containing protein [Patescibacteria group bacterium]
MQLPTEVQTTIATLVTAGYEAFAVGGCVRDLLLRREPRDWDVNTNAKPDEIQSLFPKTFYTNDFGTVTVLTGSEQAALKEIEVTTYRIEAGYSDQRHPDNVDFTDILKEDLARRDFTINAMAMNEEKIMDPFEGQRDLEDKLIRAVGNPSERFSEDALRMLRAIRLAAELNFELEDETFKELRMYAEAISAVSHERVRDELVKIVASQHPEKGFTLLKDTGLLGLILPEVAEGIAVGQNKHHIFTVYEHNVKSLQFAADFKYPLSVRLAALWHDIGKPKTKRAKGNDYTFHAHDIVGARMTEKLMRRLKFSNELIAKVVHLVRYHMFYYDVGKVTEAGARRLLRRVGKDHFPDLIKLRIAERKGSGVPKAEPYRLRHLQFLVEKAAQQPISTSQLAIAGQQLMDELKLKPGPQIGGILNALLAEVLDDPKKNQPAVLLKRAQELKDKDPAELKALGVAATEEAERKREDDIKRKYHV